DTRERLWRALPEVAPEEGNGARIGCDQAEEHPQERALARAVRPEEAMDLAHPDTQVEVREGGDRAEALGHPGDLNRRRHLRRAPVSGSGPARHASARPRRRDRRQMHTATTPAPPAGSSGAHGTSGRFVDAVFGVNETPR